jgi:hypothetical protein
MATLDQKKAVPETKAVRDTTRNDFTPRFKTKALPDILGGLYVRL